MASSIQVGVALVVHKVKRSVLALWCQVVYSIHMVDLKAQDRIRQDLNAIQAEREELFARIADTRDEVRDLVVDARTAGITKTELSQRLDISRPTIDSMLREAERQSPPHPKA